MRDFPDGPSRTPSAKLRVSAAPLLEKFSQKSANGFHVVIFLWLMVITACFGSQVKAAEGVLTNWYQYSLFGATQGVMACKFTLATNLYDQTTSRMMKSTDGGASFSEVEFQQGASNSVIVSTGIGYPVTNQFQFRTNAVRGTFSTFGRIIIETNGGASNQLYTLTNGLIGAQVINTNLSAASNFFPLVGIKLANGVWTCLSNQLFQTHDGGSNQLTCTNISIQVIDAGPLLCEYEVIQIFHRKLWSFGAFNVPEGTGSNKTMIRMEALRPIIEIEPRTDSQLWVRFNLDGGVTNANRLRYRNADSSYLSLWGGRLGYLWGVAATNDVNNGSSGVDIIKDFGSGIDIAWEYSGSTTNLTHDLFGATCPSSNQGGSGSFTRGVWYALENTNGAVDSAAVFGIGNSATSAGRGAGITAQGFYPFRISSSGHYGFEFVIYHRDATGVIKTNSAHRLFLFSTLRTNIVNSTSAYYWPITEESSKCTGFSFRKESDWNVDPALLDLKTDWGTYTLTRQQVTNLLNRLRSGEANLSNFLVTADSANSDIVNALADASGTKTLTLSTNIFNNASNLFKAHREQDASLVNTYNFLQGGQTIGRELVRLDILQMLATFDAVPAFTLFKAKQLQLIYSRCLFDQDWYPLDNILLGLFNGNLGTANMPIQFEAQRKQASLANDPYYTSGLYSRTYCITNVFVSIDEVIDNAGGWYSSPHYGGTITPDLEVMMMLDAKGFTNMALGLRSKMTNLAEFLMTMVTPIPEPRFSSATNRLRTSMGDGEIVGVSTYGQLDRLLRTIEPELSMRLKKAWVEQGKYLNAYYQPGHLTIYIDENITNSLPTSRHVPGYWSHLRTRAGTGYEGSLWLMNGSYPTDHIGYRYAGAPSFYLLGAPIGPERTPYPLGFDDTVISTMYRTDATPTNGVEMTSTNTIVVNGAWSWNLTPTNTLFAAFANSGITDCKRTKSNDIYYTTSALISPSPTFDVLLIDDRFTNRLEQRYITTSLNVTGNLSGTVNATTPVYTFPPGLPQLGSTNFVGPGLLTLSWTNASWPNHASGGAHLQVAAHLKDESNAVHSAYWDTTSAYEPKRDVYLRFVCSNDSARLIIARKPTAAVCTITTNADTGAFYIVNGREELRASTNTWEYSLGTQTNSAACFQGTAQFVATNGIGISGGPAEMVLTRAVNTNFTISLSGPTGVRIITNASLAYPLVCAASGANITRYASR